MIKIDYSIELISDAEIATGMGSGLLDAIAPRDLDGNFIVPASHIKGLLRQSLKDVESLLPEHVSVAVEKLLGSAGERFDLSGLISLSDAKSEKSEAMVVSRTALNKFGVAKDGSLRTTEAVPAGTVFKGSVFVDAPEKSGFDELTRYALLSVMELGGSRSRGCGACVVKIANENRKPGDLLLAALNANYESSAESVKAEVCGDVCKSVFVRLEFTTKSPICLPETPVVGNNTIRSGWTIPASAVQGMILTRINALNSDVATACFESPLFRAWPMLPVPTEAEYDSCVPVRASASHKISKLADENTKQFTFCDETIEEYDWKKQPKNAPIKSADGILMRCGEKVVLWRSGDMARFLSAHGVINGEDAVGENRRNLFTVESLAERKFVGFVAMPENAYELLKRALAENCHVQLGKSRSVRGNGMLNISVTDKFPLDLPEDTKKHETVAGFIVQSPILLSDSIDRNLSAAELLANAVENAGWGKVKKGSCSASTQILFGWNRNKNGRQKAELVIAPGSVFVLENAADNWQDLVVKGLGEGRERGFGAVLPHPGVADDRYRREEDCLIEIPKSDGYAKVAWSLKEKSKLSASQISRLLALTEANAESALNFLAVQKDERPQKFWDAWKPVWEEVGNLVKADSKRACKIFKVWYDLTVAEGK